MGQPDHISPRKGSGIYVYMRRVPAVVADVDRRGLIRESLRTRDKAVALAMARKLDAANEEYWAGILQGKSPKDGWDQYEAAQKIVRAMGFTNKSTQDLLLAPTAEVSARLAKAHEHKDDPLVVHAVLGAVSEPSVTIDDLIKIYRRHMKVALAALSENQRRKHMNARERAVATLKEVVGAPPLSDLSREHVLRYRDHWAARVLGGEVLAETAAREFANIKGIFTAVDDELGTNYGTLWADLKIRRKGVRQKTRTRPPYPNDFIQNELLKPGALDGMNLQARLIVYTMVETGLRLSEACNLRKDDIILDADIPHISIQERSDRQQKTAYSIRTVPLVGVSLWALKQAPDGFSKYRDKEDSASATINKFLLENGLRPTPKHTIYSLRHSFQDRILDAGASDRLQTDLMGHEFDREEYGAGSSMKAKLALLEKIQLVWTPPES